MAILFSLAFAPGLRNILIDSTSEAMYVPDDPEVRFYQEVRETFGDDTTLTLMIKSDNIFTYEILKSVERLSLAGEGIVGVTRVVSLTTVSNLKGEDGVLQTDDLLANIPKDPAELQQIRKDALSNQILIGEVVNKEGKATAVHLFIESRPDDKKFNDRLVAEVESLLEAERRELGDGVELYQIGSSLLKSMVTEQLTNDLVHLIPLSALALLFILYFFFRTTVAMVIPCVTGLLSVVGTLGFMGVMGFSINPMTTVIPTLLIVVGCTEDIHLISSYALGLQSKLTKNMAIKRMALKSGTAILLTSFTTLVGFATMMVNTIPMLIEFGIVSSFGLVLNFFLTITLVPSVLRWYPTSKRLFSKSEKDSLLWLQNILIAAITKYRRQVITIIFLMVGVAIWGCSKVKVDTDYLAFFRADSEIIRLFNDASENLSGATVFYVVVDTGREDGIQEPEVMQQLAGLSDFLSARYDNAVGYTDFIRKLHMEMNDGKPEFWKTPDSAELISQYTMMLDPDDVDRFCNFDSSKTSILVRNAVRGSQNILYEEQQILEYVKKNMSPDLKVRVTGEMILVSRSSDVMSYQVVMNLLLIFAVIWLVISLLFASPKAGLLAMIPNIMPVLVNFSVMGFFGIPLSTAIFPVVVVPLGIAVDDTIHFMVKFSDELRTNSDNDVAVINTIKHEIKPVVSTSMALMMGFFVLYFGEFGSTQDFGVLSALAMLTALISDLFITPTILKSLPLISTWDMLKLKINRQLVEVCPLFMGLTQRQIRNVAILGKLQQYQKDDYIIKQGSVDKNIIVILKGKSRVEAEDSITGNTVILENAGLGAVLGEMAFFTGHKRSANVIAEGETEVLMIDKKRFDRIQRRSPKLAAHIYHNLAALLSVRTEKNDLALLNSAASHN